jgi:putative membrane protein
MNKTMLLLGFAAVFAAAPAQAQSPRTTTQAAATQSPLSATDRQFLMTAIQGDLAEVQVGKLAQEKAQSQDVKQFAQTLQQDHSENLQKARQLAQESNIQAPSEPNAEQQQEYQRLSKLSGQEFDQQFAQSMVKDHKETISQFQKQAQGRGMVARFAQQSLPTLQKHLQTSQSLGSSGAATGAGNQ